MFSYIYLIAPRRPPGQDMLALGFVVERRRYKRQCKDASKDLENELKNSEIDARILRKSAEIQVKIDPKWSENGAKRDKKCNHRLQDDLGAPRRRIPPLSCAGRVPTWSPKSNKN